MKIALTANRKKEIANILIEKKFEVFPHLKKEWEKKSQMYYMKFWSLKYGLFIPELEIWYSSDKIIVGASFQNSCFVDPNSGKHIFDNYNDFINFLKSIDLSSR